MIPALSGTQEIAGLRPPEHAGLINALNGLADDLNVLVVETAAGISDSVFGFVRASREVLPLMRDEPSPVTDNYDLIKISHRDHGASHFRVFGSMVCASYRGVNLCKKREYVTHRFLGVIQKYAGEAPFDDSERRSVGRLRASIKTFPGRRSFIACRKLAKNVVRWSLLQEPVRHFKFFVERLVSNPVRCLT